MRKLIDYEAFCGLSNPADEAAEITPQQLAQRITARGDLQLVDVREPFELEICCLPGALHIPLRDLPSRLGELDARRDIVTVCHHGVRSLRAREILRGAGFGKVRSLRGGVDAWAAELDATMERY